MVLTKIGENADIAQESPDPGAFEKYRDTPPISIAILLQKYAQLEGGSRKSTL